MKPRLSERHGGASGGRECWKLILSAVSLFGVLVIAGCTGTEERQESDEPMVEETAVAEPTSGQFSLHLGQALFIVGQDVSSINAYVEGVGTVPAGVTGYSSFKRQEGLTLEANYGDGLSESISE